MSAPATCAGGAAHYMGALTFRITAPNGATGYACANCNERAHHDHVFRDAVVRCVAAGTTFRETEATFARAGLTMPTTPAGVRGLLAEMSRRVAAETGMPPVPVDTLMRGLKKYARRGAR